MANWCTFEIGVTGGTEHERQQLAAEENDKLEWLDKHRQWLHNDNRENFWYWPAPGGSLHRPNQKPFRLDPDTGELYMGWAERKWHLPIDWIEELSRRYPDMTFTTRYYVEETWDSGVVVTDGGVTRRTELDVGYFFTANTAPIHHYAVSVKGETDEIRDGCIETGCAIAAYEYDPLDEIATRDPYTLQAYISSHYGVSCDWLPMSLDEETYLGSVMVQATDRTRSELIRVCERDIVLASDEPDYLDGHLLPFAEDRKLHYWFMDWNIPNPMTARLKDRSRHPLPAEILCLMERPETTKARWRELQNALKKPRWTSVWPLWDIREAERRQARQEEK